MVSTAGFDLMLAHLAAHGPRGPCPSAERPVHPEGSPAQHVTGECPVPAHLLISSRPRFQAGRASRRALVRELDRRQARIDHLIDANALAAEEILRLKVDLQGAHALLAARGVSVDRRARRKLVPA